MALIQHDQCPYKRGRLEHRHTQRDGPVRTQGEGMTRREASEGTSLVDTFVSAF